MRDEFNHILRNVQQLLKDLEKMVLKCLKSYAFNHVSLSNFRLEDMSSRRGLHRGFYA
jgi:hypothetical protein